MNCQLCQKELERYCEGSLPPDIMIRVKEHLGSCSECNESYRLQLLSDRIFIEEKELQPNPFLVTRIMAGIDGLESNATEGEPIFTRVIRTALLTVSLAAAVFAGILLGNFSAAPDERVPLEMAMMDDAAIESVIMLSNE